MAEMSVIRDGITSNSADLTEYGCLGKSWGFSDDLELFLIWLVVTGTMEFFMTFQKQLGMEWNFIIPTDELTNHHFSEGFGLTTNQLW